MTRCCPKWNLQPGLEWKTSQAQPIRVQSNSLRGGSQTHHDIQVAQENLMILFGAGRRRKRLGKQGQYSALWYIYKKNKACCQALQIPSEIPTQTQVLLNDGAISVASHGRNWWMVYPTPETRWSQKWWQNIVPSCFFRISQPWKARMQQFTLNLILRQKHAGPRTPGSCSSSWLALAAKPKFASKEMDPLWKWKGKVFIFVAVWIWEREPVDFDQFTKKENNSNKYPLQLV